jgi:hypothetical protein
MGIVRENLDFERGLDPKKSIGLGYVNIHTDDDMLKVFPRAVSEESNWDKGELWNLGNGLKAIAKFQIIHKGKSGTTYSSDFDIDEIFQEYPKKIIWKNPIFENINFERGMEPKQSMNIGKIKLIQDWMDEVGVGVKNFLVNDKFEIDTPMDIILTERPEMFSNGKLPEYIRFNSSGSFDADDSGVVSLEGFPRVVQGYFSCQQNEITSLEEFPIKIEKDCYVMSNGKDFIKDEIQAICDVGGEIEADDSDV